MYRVHSNYACRVPCYVCIWPILEASEAYVEMRSSSKIILPQSALEAFAYAMDGQLRR